MKRGAPLKRRTPLLSNAQQRRRPRKTGPPRTTRDLVLERDSGCAICGCGPYGLQVHHRKPRRMGGRTDPAINSPANLLSLCPADYAWVESSRGEALEMGLLVAEHEDPAQVLVLHWLWGSVFLLDDGTVGEACARITPDSDGAP